MMLCDADFDELFPWTTPAKRRNPRAETRELAAAIRALSARAGEVCPVGGDGAADMDSRDARVKNRPAMNAPLVV